MTSVSGEVDGWDFKNPVHIHFGDGALERLRALGGSETSLLVTTSGSVRRGLAGRVVDLLGGPERVAVFDEVTANPEIRQVGAAAERIRRKGAPGQVVALGGGSALDFGKALRVLLADPGFSLEAHLLEGAPLPDRRPLPLVAIPTTAGTGSEVTPFATMWDGEASKKYSVAGPDIFPQAAILDPRLTLTLPEEETIHTGLDALSQGLEAIWNRNANPISTLFASRAVSLALQSLPAVVRDLEDPGLRGAMLQASLLAGLAISSTRTALAHSISYPLTARYGVPHGLACGFTLPALSEFNATGDDSWLAHLSAFHAPHGLSSRLLEVLSELRTGVLIRRYIPDVDAILAVAPEMLTPGRADNNLRAATVQDVENILRKSWDGLMELSS